MCMKNYEYSAVCLQNSFFSIDSTEILRTPIYMMIRNIMKKSDIL